MRTLCVISCAWLALTLAGCASPFATSQIEPPAEILMKPPAALSKPRAGDDLVQSHAKLRRKYATESGKLRRLQTYVRTIREE